MVLITAAGLNLSVAQQPESDETRNQTRSFDNYTTRQADDLRSAQKAESPLARAQAINAARGFLTNSQTAAWQQSAPSPFAQSRTPSLFGHASNFSIDPALAKTINNSNEGVSKLIKQLKETKDDQEKQTIKSDIKTELEVQYDAYLEYHEQPLKQLEERLAKLREEFEARKQAKDDLVKLRLDTIWYDSLGLGWPGNRNLSLWRNTNTAPAGLIPSGHFNQDPFGAQPPLPPVATPKGIGSSR